MGSSSIARTTGFSLAASDANSASPFARQLPASIPARSFTRSSLTPSSSTRSIAVVEDFAIQSLTRFHEPRTSLAAAAISTTASAAAAVSSRSTKTVAKFPFSLRRRSSSRTRLVFPIRRCAVTSVCVPSSTRSMSASISAYRSKKRSPSTQFPPAFLKPIGRLPINNVGNKCVGNNNVGTSAAPSRAVVAEWDAVEADLGHRMGRGATLDSRDRHP